jgi:hypothetical protein
LADTKPDRCPPRRPRESRTGRHGRRRRHPHGRAGRRQPGPAREIGSSPGRTTGPTAATPASSSPIVTPGKSPASWTAAACGCAGSTPTPINP